jgi:hypothetical protein
MDESKNIYLHPIAGSDADRVGAGVFTKPWFDTRGDERIS